MKKSLLSLVWVVFVDSLGWGIAFSVFAVVLFGKGTSMLPEATSESTRYVIYESLLAVYSFFMFFFAPFLGGIADRYGRKPGLQISMLGLTTGFIFCALGCYYLNIWLLAIGRVVSGITAGSLSIAQAAAIDLSNKESKAFYLSIMMLANCLGFSLGPVLGGLLVQTNLAPTGTFTFLVGALMSILGFLALNFFFHETYQPEKEAFAKPLWHDFLNIKYAFMKPVLKNYLSAILLSMMAFGLFFSNIPVFINRQFVSNSDLTGTILSVEAVVFSLVLMFGGKYVFSNFSKCKVVLLAQLVQAICYFALASTIHVLSSNVLFFTFISAFAGLMYIGLLTLVSDTTEANWQGRIMGVVASISSLTWGVGPILTAWLNHYQAETPFLFSVVLVTIGMLFLLLLTKKSKAFI